VQVVFDAPTDPAAPDPYLAPMLFQPYVENAFKHGVSATAPSRITISLRQQGAHQVTMCVRNTLFANRAADPDEPGGIGLANTQRRLDLLYPDRYQLRTTAPTALNEYEVCLSLHLLP
jgi:two-component system LytT family sensor kinase